MVVVDCSLVLFRVVGEDVQVTHKLPVPAAAAHGAGSICDTPADTMITTEVTQDSRFRPCVSAAGVDWASAAVLVTVVLWASSFVVIRDAGPRLSPAPMALLRLAVAAVALTVPVTTRTGRFTHVPRAPYDLSI